MGRWVADARGSLEAWTPTERRGNSLVVLGLAALLVIVGVVTAVQDYSGAGAVLLVVIVLLVLALVFEGLIFATGAPAAAAQAASAVPAGPAAAKSVKLRCGACKEVFTVQDTGERPLYHSCPHCGSQGVLRAKPAGPGGALAPTVKRVTLKCNACAEVFKVEDTGVRPLTHSCPGCGRPGILR